MKLAWTPAAIADRDRQADYIARDSPRAAVEQFDRVESVLDVLAEHPQMGRRGRVRGTRELVVAGTPFVAVYRIKAKIRRIEILRLLHGAQRWPPAHGRT